MAKTDAYADIDFEEINDITGLANDDIKCLKVSNQDKVKEQLRLWVILTSSSIIVIKCIFICFP